MLYLNCSAFVFMMKPKGLGMAHCRKDEGNVRYIPICDTGLRLPLSTLHHESVSWV